MPSPDSGRQVSPAVRNRGRTSQGSVTCTRRRRDVGVGRVHVQHVGDDELAQDERDHGVGRAVSVRQRGSQPGAKCHRRSAAPCEDDRWDQSTRPPRRRRDIGCNWVPRPGPVGVAVTRRRSWRASRTRSPDPAHRPAGLRTDLQVEAPAAPSSGQHTVRVVIEAKGCWNPELADTAQTQLRAYLSEPHTAGLPLVSP